MQNMDPKKFCFIGHVDSGKSSTAGHLYVKCGGLSEHELNKLKKESEKNNYQLWSRVLDIWEEEQQKGKTHEFNLLPFTYNDQPFELIDTPGHKIFIRSLIEGLTYFESTNVIGCLIISMSKGEFESGWDKGQTKEDIILARSVGIRSLIVLFNKMDTIDFDQEKYEIVKKQVKKFIEDCRFETVDYIPISGYQGIGLTDKEGLPDWYKENTLMDTISQIEPKQINIPEIPKDEWNTMICEIKILFTNNIITKGYQCVLHFDGQEFEAKILQIRDKSFLKVKDTGQILISTNKIIKKNRKTRKIILRSEDHTIGFGRILKVK